MKMNGANILVECLKEQGVELIFGYPGGTVLNIYDALYDTEDLTHIITAHEQGAVHAADGYARATGKVGVVLVTSGPGASNSVTGIATAYRDSVPLVAITGQVARHLIGKDSFQEINITDITKKITKANYLVMEPEDLPHIIREAFHTARSGRPGPVLIDIPKDIQQAVWEYVPYDSSASSSNQRNFYDSSDMRAAVQLINDSARPVIFAGGGIISSGAEAELLCLAEKLLSPVSCSLMGLGGFPGQHPQFAGMLGMHGSFASNHAFTNADLVIALGTRLNDRVTCKTEEFAHQAKILHIDIDSNEFGKTVIADLSICGDLKIVLSALLEEIEERHNSEWCDEILAYKEKHDSTTEHQGSLNPEYLFQKLKELTGDDVILCTEVGQHQMWTAKYYPFNTPRSFISPGGLGTMGFGLGAAIGCALGRPDKKVINIAGDGSFKMNMNELSTVSKYNIPLIQVVMNNSALGMVKQWQTLFYNNRHSQTILTPDVEFTQLAKAFGIHSIRIEHDDEVEDAFKQALSMDQPVLIECVIASDNMATPMVPLGKGIQHCTHVNSAAAV